MGPIARLKFWWLGRQIWKRDRPDLMSPEERYQYYEQAWRQLHASQRWLHQLGDECQELQRRRSE